ncbi:MAG: hypothetical protein AB7U73_20365 [Pirellulales bacterium]
MFDWQRLAQNSLRTGAVASATTTLAAAACGALERRSALGPINAVSHIAWGDRAAHQDRPSLRYSLTGLILNTAAVTSWAALHEICFGRTMHRDAAPGARIASSLLGGVFVSALAYVTDYKFVPRRLTPGFELRLSDRSLLGIYTALAVGLGLGGLLGEPASKAARATATPRPPRRSSPRRSRQTVSHKPR